MASSLLSSESVYDGEHAAGVLSLVVAGGVSGFAVWVAFLFVTIRSPAYQNTHVIPYLISLLVANVLQAAGTAMNAKWVIDREVESGPFCTLQGATKQAGNVGMALWSFVLAGHLFNLLFLRWKTTFRGLLLTLVGGWFSVALIVAIGPLAIQKNNLGPYFGPSGYWCWITASYPREQTFLEYFFEFVSAGVSFVLYTIILLRVRGNIIRSGGHYKLRLVPRGESWQLAIHRDIIDTSTLQVTARMVWYPVAYTILLLPVSLARLIEFGGRAVPFWAVMLADFIFNLQGLVNVILLLSTRHLIPDTAALPSFSTQRKTIDFTSSEAVGITPYVLPPKPEEVVLKPEAFGDSGMQELNANDGGPPSLQNVRCRDSVESRSVYSTDSRASMVPKPRFTLTRPMSWRK